MLVIEPRTVPLEITLVTPVAVVRMQVEADIVADEIVRVLLPTLVTAKVPAQDSEARPIGEAVCMAKVVVEVAPGPSAKNKQTLDEDNTSQNPLSKHRAY